jgi:hypothetical protein
VSHSPLPVRAGLRAGACILLASLALAGCRDDKVNRTAAPQTGQAGAIAALQAINSKAVTCWMRSRDPAFAGLRLIPELDTQYGRPRLLLLKKNSQYGLPVLVVEAHGSPVKVETYGPLTQGPVGSRIEQDIRRWSTGSQACVA